MPKKKAETGGEDVSCWAPSQSSARCSLACPRLFGFSGDIGGTPFRITTAGIVNSHNPLRMNQLWPTRFAPMREVISHFANDRPINMLEIGTWFGIGSTALFLEILPRGSSITLVDSWRKYMSSEDQKAALSARLKDLVPHAAINSALRQIYKFEEMRPDIEVIIVRGVASRVLTAYKPKIFDCIYVDGSHYYDAVKADLQIAKYLLKDDGLLCGDDHELPRTPELIALAKSHLTSDFLKLPDGRGFHPGVMLAISEELPKVNMQDGFWWTHLRSNVNVE